MNTPKEIIDHAAPFPMLFATLTGSRVFGYDNAFSDYDVHGAHLLTLDHLLGFGQGNETIERKFDSNFDLYEMATHDLKKFILLLIKGNVNVLETLYSPIILLSSGIHEELKELAKECISQLCAECYVGMAKNQQRHMQENNVKKLLHLYRCLLMGIHMMHSGKVEYRLDELARIYNQPQFFSMLSMKRGGYNTLDTKEMAEHMISIEGLSTRLEQEKEASLLPKETPEQVKRDLEQFLIRVRLQYPNSN